MITFLRDRMWWIDTIILSHLSLGPYIALPTQYSICFSGAATWATLTRTCRRRRRPSLVIRLPSECVRTSHDCCAPVIRVKCLLEATAHDFNALHWFHSICLSGCLHHSPSYDVCGDAFSAPDAWHFVLSSLSSHFLTVLWCAVFPAQSGVIPPYPFPN